MKKQDSFKIPEHYFEQTKTRLKKIPALELKEKQPKVIKLQHYVIGSLAAAALVILAFFIWPEAEEGRINSPAQPLSQIEDEALLQYLTANASLNEFNYFLVEDQYAQEDILLQDAEMIDYLETQPLDFYNLWKIYYSLSPF